MTFDSLLVDMRRYLERGFTEASDPIVYEQLPRLVTLAERRIANDFKLQGFLRAVNTVTSAIPAYRKPDRWRNTVSMRVNGQPLFARSYDYLRGYTGCSRLPRQPGWRLRSSTTKCLRCWTRPIRPIGLPSTHQICCCTGLCLKLHRSSRTMNGLAFGRPHSTALASPSAAKT